MGGGSIRFPGRGRKVRFFRFGSMSKPDPTRVLFVCLGNICRSPAAEIIFRAAVERAGLSAAFEIDSCGTASYHTGQKPDRRMLAALERAGYAWGGHRARTFSRADFSRFDLIIPQDESNREDVLMVARSAADAARVQPMRHWFPEGCSEIGVPDPYYGGEAGFDAVVSLLEQACERLLDTLSASSLNSAGN